MPFVLAIGVLVFLGSFVPMVGATVAGTVAVLVALVDQGPITALLMLGGVILVQQIEGHILQPFLMGRWVSVHPLGVIVAIGCGVLVAGHRGRAGRRTPRRRRQRRRPAPRELHRRPETIRSRSSRRTTRSCGEEPPTEESVKHE